MACSSSMSEQWTLRPSSVPDSDESGLNTPSLASQSISPTKHRHRRESTGDFRTMRFDSSQMILAWSRFVAALTTSGPFSPSAMSI